MPAAAPQFDVSLASCLTDVKAAQRLRYDVFVAELGATGPLINHEDRLEIDPFDNCADHLILRDLTCPETSQVVGVYRLISAPSASAFSCETEYDLKGLRASGKALLELSRSCLHPDYRGGTAMFHLWQALAHYIVDHNVDLLFGVASFHGTQVDSHAGALAMLFDLHKSPYGVSSRQSVTFPTQTYEKKRALQQTPALIKAYLRLGGAVGQGVFVDEAFNTTDVCMILDIANMPQRQKAIYSR